MKFDRVALIADARIPAAARIMAMLLLELGEGWHEVRHDQFRALLADGPSDETIRRHLRRLEGAGWIETNTETGRRPPQYRIVPVADSGSFSGIREALVTSLAQLLPHTEEGQTGSMPHTHEGLGFLPHRAVGHTGLSPTPLGGRRPPSSSSLPLPPPQPLQAGVREAIEEAIELDGCRDQLVAYLELGRSQFPEAYVRNVQGIIGGLNENAWTDQFGGRVSEGRPVIVAGCLDHLCQTDEVDGHFKASPGDVKNLISQIRYRVKSEAGAKRDARRSRDPGTSGGEATGPRSRGARAQQPTYVEG